MNWTKVSLLAISFVLVFQAEAALIDNDAVIPNTFKDLNTGLVWLNPSKTNSGYYSSRESSHSSRSYEYTVDEILTRYSNFQIATQTQVETLIKSIFSNVSYDADGNYSYRDSWSRDAGGDYSVYDPLFNDDFVNFMQVVGGVTYRYSSSRDDGDRSRRDRISGYFLTDSGHYGWAEIARSESESYSSNSWFDYKTNESKTSSIRFDASANGVTGSSKVPLFMVQRAVSVSEPNAAWLMMVILVMFLLNKTQSANLFVFKEQTQ